jgi:hypothetical protein
MERLINDIDKKSSVEIMTPEEVALFTKKSVSWVYKHWHKLGGVKLGGSLFFPNKEDLYEHLFKEGQGMEVRLHPKGDQAHRGLVQNENGGQKSRSQKKGGIRKPDSSHDCPNRHGILRPA